MQCQVLIVKEVWNAHGHMMAKSSTGLNSEKEGKGTQLEIFAILFVKKCVCNKMELVKIVGLEYLENSEFTTRYAAVTQECLISVHDVRREKKIINTMYCNFSWHHVKVWTYNLCSRCFYLCSFRSVADENSLWLKADWQLQMTGEGGQIGRMRRQKSVII